MHDSLFIIVEIGAGFAAIITFMATFVTVFRKWVLDRIDRDLGPHLADRDDLAARQADRARGSADQAAVAAAQAADAAKQAAVAAADALESARHATDAACELREQARPPGTRRSGDTAPGRQRSDGLEGGRAPQGDVRR
jgi:hypothetical protein